MTRYYSGLFVFVALAALGLIFVLPHITTAVDDPPPLFGIAPPPPGQAPDGGKSGGGPSGPVGPNVPLAPTENMALIPAGSFAMGCAAADNECDSDELPVHRVTLDAFQMDVHQVTVAEYAQCVSQGACRTPRSPDDGWQEFYTWNRPGLENHPVTGVDWNDANTYCRWRNKRLPTEAEFEYALRGRQDGFIFPWGNAPIPPPRYGNYNDATLHRTVNREGLLEMFPNYDDGYAGAAPVCSYARNSYGLCDISGNVWEWVADWYGPYSSSTARNPQGPPSGDKRILRGGCWGCPRPSDRNSVRFATTGDDVFAGFGFRCARNGGE